MGATDRLLHYLDCMEGSWVCTEVKMDQVVSFKDMQFIVCQSYLDSSVFKMYLFKVLVLERHYFENLLTCSSLFLDCDR